MPLYDLAVDGLQAFYQRRPGAKKLVRREPVVGTIDGVNTVFLLSQPPVLYDSVVLYSSADPLTPLATECFDADGGVVRLTPAPGSAVVADYTAVPLYTRQMIYITMAGFQLMESLWQRGLALSSDAARYVQATEEDHHLYVVTRNGDEIADPKCGSTTFSGSWIQRTLLARCIELAYLDSLSSEAAMSDVEIRERLGGVSINPTRRTSNLLLARKIAEDEMRRTLESAMEEFYGEAGFNAELATMPSTIEYETVWHWQVNSNGFLRSAGA